MTFLTKMEIDRFNRLIKQHKWDDAAVYGKQLLEKDPRDGSGIRYGVMDAYAVLGNSVAAEKLAQRYSENSTNHECWFETLDDVMLLQLAMAYWKDDCKEKAIKMLKTLPEYGKEYLSMSKAKINSVKTRLDTQTGYSPCTVEAYVECIAIPYEDQALFRTWYNETVTG